MQADVLSRLMLPILEEGCQICHRAGEIALAAFRLSRTNTAFRPNVIAAATQNKSMPPWFADTRIGHFSNDPSLSAGQIAALAAGRVPGAPAGDARQLSRRHIGRRVGVFRSQI